MAEQIKRVWARTTWVSGKNGFWEQAETYRLRSEAGVRQVLRGETTCAAAAELLGIRAGTMARRVRKARLAAGA